MSSKEGKGQSAADRKFTPKQWAVIHREVQRRLKEKEEAEARLLLEHQLKEKEKEEARLLRQQSSQSRRKREAHSSPGDTLRRAFDALRRKQLRHERRERRLLIIDSKDDSQKDLEEIKRLKAWVTTVKNCSMNLIRSSIVSALRIPKGNKKRVQSEVIVKVVPETIPNIKVEADEMVLKKDKVRRGRRPKVDPQSISSINDNKQHLKKTTIQRKRKQDFSAIKKSGIPLEKVPIQKMKDEKSGLFVCIICQEKFQTQKGISTHFIYHTESEISEANIKTVLKDENEKSDKDFRMVMTYKCEVCSEKFFAKRNYRRHIIDTHGDNLELLKSHCFPCSFCDRFFYRKSSLILHQRNVHDIFTQCPVCNENIKTQELFSKHVDEAHPDCSKKYDLIMKCPDGYFCKICGFCQKTFAYILQHTKEHSGRIQVQSFLCDVCGRKFDSNGKLGKHRLHCQSQRTFPCELCGKVFSYQYRLRDHHLTHEELGKRKRLECKKCGKTFASRNSLLVHDTAMHEKKRPWECSVCGKNFSCASALHIHKTSVCEKDKAKPRTCPTCGKTLDNYLLLVYHKANFHKFGNTEETFCHLCQKTFRDPLALYAHNRQSHILVLYENQKMPPSATFTCAVCGMNRPNKLFLLEHYRKHREERPFKCNLCENTFKYSTQFSQHKKSVHKNEMDFAKMITDVDMNENLKKDFQEAHAAQFTQFKPRKASKDNNLTTSNNMNGNGVSKSNKSCINSAKDNLFVDEETAEIIVFDRQPKLEVHEGWNYEFDDDNCQTMYEN